jgi:DNA polymerase (family 10)
LIEQQDLKGILHCHTSFSDGSNTLDEMAEATRKLGMQYFGVCDHSQSAAYAGGMRFEKVRAQHQMADKLNQDYETQRFRIFKGVESDILEGGALDYIDAQLAEFDFIVASVHSRFQLGNAEQTARIVNAVRNPHTTILGHATGRLLLQREGYDVDLDEILKACAEHGVAVEINADPHRLDLDWRWHARALELGCMLSINPDAHDTGGLLNQKWGVIVARKGGVPAERVLNCMDLSEFEKHLAERKKRTARL